MDAKPNRATTKPRVFRSRARKQAQARAIEEKNFRQGFAETSIDTNMRELALMSDEELAHWQSLRDIGSGAHILAEKEWERRLADKSIRATRKAMWVTAASTLASVVVGWALGFFGR
ncbi:MULTISPECIES: hypothetical protein [Delftia]|uniref:Uncharacterized protein n=1 Tax=Delftia deserti TaxID=1651218 RepID=A0ABW5EN63_9BURK